MSGRASGWVLASGPRPDDIDRDGAEYGLRRARGLRMVLLAVADAANHDGKHAHPGINLLAEGTLYSRRQVISLLAELEAEGWLEVEQQGGGHGRATVYRVCMERRDPPGDNGAVPAPIPEGGTVQSERLTVQSHGDTVQPDCTPTVSQRSTNGTPLVDEDVDQAPVLLPPLENETRFAPPDPTTAVFDAWIEATGRHPSRTKLDAKRRKLIRKALDGYPLDDVLAAVRGWRNSPHHRGENRTRTVYNDLDLLLRDPAHIERFRDFELAGPTASTARPRSADAIVAFVAGSSA